MGLEHLETLAIPGVVSTSTDKRKILGGESTSAAGSQDMTVRVWAEPKDLLVQTSRGGGIRQTAAWTKEKAGSLTVELAWEIFTDG